MLKEPRLAAVFFGSDTPLRGFTSQSDVSLRRNGFAVVASPFLFAPTRRRLRR
jgi:hypothetical protein